MLLCKLFYWFKVCLLLLAFLLIKIGEILLKILKLPKYLKFSKRSRPNRVFPKTSRLKLALISLSIIIIINSLLISKLVTSLPSPYTLTTTQRPQTTEIYDQRGKLLYQIYKDRNRKQVKLENISPFAIQATIAIEDKHFYFHPGVDPAGLLRAFQTNFPYYFQGKPPVNGLQGGSTITQQLIKNTLLSPEKTLTRKVKEIFLALWAERIYSKKEILQMYLNESPYGGPAWGIETASQMYFGKSAKDVTLAESAYLAGLPAAPTKYSHYGIHPEQGKKRQEEVLRRMLEDKYISKNEAEEALFQPLTFQPPISSIKAPHFVMYVRSLLAEKYGERVVSQGGLKVITTLDLDLQEMAEEVVFSEVEKLKTLRVQNGAAMITDAQNGQILAMVGSKDYFDPKGGNFNVTLALRQPGSAIKVITYTAAFKLGYSPGTILLDIPTTFPPPAGGSWGKPYSPVNYDGRFHGPVTIRTALGSSYNIPAVKMLNIIGLPAMLSTAKDLGINTLNNPQSYGLSLTLGGGAVKMLEMMGVYGTLASGGVYLPPQAILQIKDADGNVLEDNQKTRKKRVLTEEVAYLLNHILADNNGRTPAFGVNSLLKIEGKTVAVKTGTSDDKRDNWTFGYTPELVVGTWVGNNDNSPMDPKLTSGITGATPIWRNIMSNLLFNRPNITFKKPAGIIETVISGYRDLAISGQTPKTVVGYKIPEKTTQ